MGNRTRDEIYNAVGDLSFYRTYQRDEDGKLTRWSAYDPLDALLSYRLFEYQEGSASDLFVPD